MPDASGAVLQVCSGVPTFGRPRRACVPIRGKTLHARLFIAQFSKGVVGIAEFLLLVRQFLLCRGELFFESGDLAEYDFVVLLVGSQLRIECCNLRFNLNAFG